jgi:hypothetical protein
MPRYAWLLVAVLASGGVLIAGNFLLWSGNPDTSEFFQTSTPVRCADAASLNVTEAGFTAFSGELKAGGDEHLLVVQLTPASAAASPERFTLREPDATYLPEAGGAPDVLVFRAPKASGAFKLAYRDDCSSLEWIVP